MVRVGCGRRAIQARGRSRTERTVEPVIATMFAMSFIIGKPDRLVVRD